MADWRSSMKAFKIDKKQQKMIEAFYKEELSMNQNAQIVKIASGIVSFFSMILPAQPQNKRF